MIGSKAKPPQTVSPMQIEATGFRAFYILKFAGNPCADPTTATIFGVQRYLIDKVTNDLMKDNYQGVFKIFVPITASDRPQVGDIVMSKINVFNSINGISHDVKGFDENNTAYLCILPTFEIAPLHIIANQVYSINCPVIPRFLIKFEEYGNTFPTQVDFELWFFQKLASGGAGQVISNFNSYSDTITFNLSNSDSLVQNAFDYNQAIHSFFDFEAKIIGLGDGVFSNCTNLRNVVLPNVTPHGIGLFNNCTSITKIVMPLADEFTYTCFENISGNDIAVQFSAAAMGSEAKTMGLFLGANNITFLA